MSGSSSGEGDADAPDPVAETVASPAAASPVANGDHTARSSVEPRATIAAASSIGRYEVVRLLGEGAMGRVYLARDPHLDRRVAIKTVRDDLPMPADTREQFLTRFRNEARAAARVAHPGIVAVHDVGEDPKHGPFLVLEYVAGATLQERLTASGALPADELLRLVDRIAKAIDAAHAASIVHRDIKPQNVLIAADGQAKLTDFGVARIPDAQLTREGQFLGTPCYAAPETLSDQEYSAASDVFSFGALVYEAATGRRAFPGDDAVAVARKVLDEDPLPPSKARRGLPDALDGVIAKALSKDRATRYRSAAELAAGVRRAFGAPLEGGAEGTDRRSGGSLAFAAVLVGSLVLGGAIVLALMRERGGLEAGVAMAGAAVRDAGVDAAVIADAGTVIAVHDAGRSRGGSASSASGGGAGSVSVTTPDVDPGAGTSDAGEAVVERPDASGMSRQEREDLAKDELDRARARLRDNDLEGARAALARARALDPTHPDIEVLEASVRRADESE